jgi:hypothetical protein
MLDRFTDNAKCVDRLVQNYIQHGSLYVAFDFDNTVFPNVEEDSFPRAETVLRNCADLKFKLILFTCREGDLLQEAINYCTLRGYTPNHVNESPVIATMKPYYNILLDDRAGLCCALSTLEMAIDKINAL